LERAHSEISRLARELGMENGLALYRIRSRWGELFGEPLSLHASPLSLREGQLLVAVDSPAWRQQLSYYQEDMLTRLAPLGVRSIRMRLGPVMRKRVRPPAPPAELKERDRRFIESLLSAIEDGDLREGIRRAAEKCVARAGLEP
jgi:predicted nucleic acid-binding Zn ribbon protein